VKACTSRPITNHPHFEDKWLRQRTERLYQIYGRSSVEDVHKILTKEKVTYVILEDSICLAPSNGCSTNDLMDLVNGHETDSNTTKFVGSNGTKRSETPRFCNKIREYGLKTETLFRLVFENRTFRVYKVLV
jgi:hypothetical protein